MRLHYGNHHPAGQHLSREGNRFDWTLVDRNAAVVDYVAALVRLRREHRALRLATHAELERHFRWSTVDWHQAIGWVVEGVPGDHDFVVLVNYRTTPADFTVSFPSAGPWRVMADGDRATRDPAGLREHVVTAATQTVRVPARRALVLMSEQANGSTP
jgi:pullulanase